MKKMYESPINVILGDIKLQMEKQKESEILRAVYKCDINVDKKELLKALKYDRDQYEKGYKDAKEELVLVTDDSGVAQTLESIKMSKIINAEQIINELIDDIDGDMEALRNEGLVGRHRDLVQFDKDWKIETIKLLKNAPTIERGRGLLLDMRLCALPKIQSADGQDYVQLFDVLETLHTFAKWPYRRGEWIDGHTCSICHWTHKDEKGNPSVINYKFCPKCGADNSKKCGD